MNPIAVCISGQIRNDDSALIQTMEALKDIEADVFFSVWQKRGTKTFSGASSIDHMARVFGVRVARALPLNWLGRMQHIFPDSSLVFPSLGDVTREDVHRIFPASVVDVEDEDFNLDFPFSDSNSLRMLYKIWRCNRMKIAAEKARGEPYKMVVRMRPDITLDFSAIAGLSPEKNTLYTHAHQGSQPGYIQDLYWLGSSEVDDKMATAFARVMAHDIDDWSGIHPELYAHTQRCGLATKPVNMVVGGIFQFAQFDNAYLARVQNNLLATVKARKNVVEAAGGEALCALAEKTIAAAIDGTNPSAVAATDFIEQVTRFGREHPDTARFGYTLGATYFTDMPDQAFPSRLAFLIYWIQLGLEAKRGNILDRTIGNLPEVFSGHEAQFYKAMTHQLALPDEFDMLVPAAWKATLSEPLSAQDSMAAAMGQLARNSRFMYWLLDWAEKSGAPEKVAELAAVQQQFGEQNIGVLIRAARAHRALGDEAQEFEALTNADALGPIVTVKARLGALWLKRDNPEKARSYLQAAVDFPNCPKWASAMLDGLEPVSS